MAGTGSGILQPTKLVQNDDFIPGAAMPGYYSNYISNVATAESNTVLFIVPDGMTCEIVDFGITASGADVVDTASTTTTSIKLDADATAGLTNVVAAAKITGGGGATTTVADGSTVSILRGSVPASGDAGYAFTAASTALGNKYGAGTKIMYTTADVDGTGATGSCLVWVRLKFVSNDARAI